MSDVSDLLKELRESANERAKSPFFLLFIAAWLFNNYEFALWLLSTVSVEDKIKNIAAYRDPFNYNTWLKLLVLPFFETIALFIVWKYLTYKSGIEWEEMAGLPRVY